MFFRLTVRCWTLPSCGMLWDKIFCKIHNVFQKSNSADQKWNFQEYQLDKTHVAAVCTAQNDDSLVRYHYVQPVEVDLPYPVYCSPVEHLNRSPKWALTIYLRTARQSTANWTTSRNCSIIGGIKSQNCPINRITARSNSNNRKFTWDCSLNEIIRLSQNHISIVMLQLSLHFPTPLQRHGSENWKMVFFSKITFLTPACS